MKKTNWLFPAGPNKGGLIRWLLTRAAVMLTLFSIILLGGGLMFKNRLIFHPVKENLRNPDSYMLSYEERLLTTSGGDMVRSWKINRPDQIDNKYTLLFFQGNSGNMSMMLDRLAALRGLGFECYSVDYPGYGPSPGQASEEALYQSAEALWQWAADNGARPETTLVYGFSLGGGVASYLAAQKKPAALILDSTFTRLLDVPAHDLPFLKPYLYLILGEAFNTKARLISDISCPLLIIHSPDDDVVPFKLAEENFKAYRHKKEMAAGQGSHMDFLLNLNLYLDKIGELRDSLAPEDSSPK